MARDFSGYFQDRHVGPTRNFNLSNRELDVVRCAASGMRMRDTALLLGIGAETVKSTWSNTFAKLVAKNQAHAVALCIRHGLIS